MCWPSTTANRGAWLFDASQEVARQGRTLKIELKPRRIEHWCLPPKQSASFVCAMEDVLEVYARPRDPKRPLVCLDEFCKQLNTHTSASLYEVFEPGQALRSRSVSNGILRPSKEAG